MAKRVLVISTSLRSGSNSEILADSFINGAVSSGSDVEKISLKDKRIAFCRGCLACQKTQKCVIDDDAVKIAEKMKSADVIVFATPIYYYEMSGQMKTLLDRANSLYPSDYAFRDIYLLSVAAEDEEGVDEGAVHGLNGWIECYEKCSLAGTVFAGGVNSAGDIDGHSALKKAYEMGSNVND
ncbi:MAG: flavodoxin family protein [Firmicutes bacterium]|nr:flavodoxin family protein [Bacillota bacterium]